MKRTRLRMNIKNKQAGCLSLDFQEFMDRSVIATIRIDNDLNINYINQATINLLKEYEKTFQRRWSKFQANEKALLGSSIDAIYQELNTSDNSFSDPNTPYWTTEISIEGLTFSASVSRVFNDQGEVQGHFIEFQDITDIRAKEIELLDLSAQFQAISKAQATIEFNMDGTIITANENFLSTMGYSLEEIKGKHHRMFAEPDFADSAEYKAFWEKLNRGEFESSEYKRLGKGGKEVWIQASYNPILGLDGKPFKVVKFASDVTEQKLKNADYSGQINAISMSQAVIEFDMDGTIINANENFLITMGYTLDEIKGKQSQHVCRA